MITGVYKTQFSGREPILLLFIISLLCVVAFGVRILHIDEPPGEFQPTRAYHGFIMARAYYYEALESAPEWKREIASLNKQAEYSAEPPILDLTASFAYRILGGEHIWIPRILATVCWIAGGIFLYLIAKRILPAGAALFSTAFYLFLPYGILASRSFQPDPLMIMALLFSIFAILRYYEQPSTPRLVIAALASALTLFIKPGVCLFQLFGVFVSLGIYKQGLRRTLIGPHSAIFAVLSLLPMLIYVLYGTFVAGFFGTQVERTLSPHLLLQPSFWAAWLLQINIVVGPYFIVALLGFLMLSKGLARALLIGLWVGYLIFGLVFTNQIIHDYYSLQLIPVVALSLGPIIALIIDYLAQVATQRYQRAAIVGVLLLAGLLAVGASINYRHHYDANALDIDDKVKMYEEVGGIVNHSASTLISAPDYGEPLKYHGWLSGEVWPPWDDIDDGEKNPGTSELTMEERLDKLEAKSEYPPDYFVIIRDLNYGRFEDQTELYEFLGKKHPIVAEGVDYWIFDLTKSID